MTSYRNRRSFPVSGEDHPISECWGGGESSRDTSPDWGQLSLVLSVTCGEHIITLTQLKLQRENTHHCVLY